MSDTAAALRAAREVQADVLAPELYQRASELFFKARHEYKFKHFAPAKDLALQARKLAEQAEFDSIRGGASRSEADPSEAFNELPSNPRAPGAPSPSKPAGYDYPLPEPTPADTYEQRKSADDAAQAQAKAAATAPSGASSQTGAPGFPPGGGPGVPSQVPGAGGTNPYAPR